MAVENQSFSAAVDDWVRATEARMVAVLRESCQRLVAEAQRPVAGGGNMPVDTGFLRASGLATKDAPTPMTLEFERGSDGTYSFNLAQTSNVLATLVPGETFYFCWTAVYAARIEYGFTGADSQGRYINQAGRGFVRLAAQNWQRIVSNVSREAFWRSLPAP